mmetsp:Transcript_52113/g.110759  ORF Transcript_52113/g.110759 Transcript_52113/m.110759 type:complete len:388 (+) Transcript_52113:119-1282(+)
MLELLTPSLSNMGLEYVLYSSSAPNPDDRPAFWEYSLESIPPPAPPVPVWVPSAIFSETSRLSSSRRFFLSSSSASSSSAFFPSRDDAACPPLVTVVSSRERLRIAVRSAPISLPGPPIPAARMAFPTCIRTFSSRLTRFSYFFCCAFKKVRCSLLSLENFTFFLFLRFCCLLRSSLETVEALEESSSPSLESLPSVSSSSGEYAMMDSLISGRRGGSSRMRRRASIVHLRRMMRRTCVLSWVMQSPSFPTCDMFPFRGVESMCTKVEDPPRSEASFASASALPSSTGSAAAACITLQVHTVPVWQYTSMRAMPAPSSSDVLACFPVPSASAASLSIEWASDTKNDRISSSLRRLSLRLFSSSSSSRCLSSLLNVCCSLRLNVEKYE